MRIPFFGAAEARTQIKNYSCRRLRGLISGRGFDSPRLHHFRVSQPISIQARPASESWRALLVLFETPAKTADLKFCRIFQSRDVDRTIRCRERLGGLLKFYPREAA